MNALCSKQNFNIIESLHPSEINEDINQCLLKKIKDKLGNKCNELGYIEKKSIQILDRTIGKINTSQFNGAVNFDINVSADIYLPVKESIIKCKILGSNQIGLFAISPPIHVIVAKIHHSNQEQQLLDSLQVNDVINVKVINYKFNLDDDHIKTITKFDFENQENKELLKRRN